MVYCDQTGQIDRNIVVCQTDVFPTQILSSPNMGMGPY